MVNFDRTKPRFRLSEPFGLLRRDARRRRVEPRFVPCRKFRFLFLRQFAVPEPAPVHDRKTFRLAPRAQRGGFKLCLPFQGDELSVLYFVRGFVLTVKFPNAVLDRVRRTPVKIVPLVRRIYFIVDNVIHFLASFTLLSSDKYIPNIRFATSDSPFGDEVLSAPNYLHER